MARTPTERDGAATRERILEAAQGAFAKRGFAGTNLAAIATAVGIRKASLYYYFPTKAELYAEVFRGIFADIAVMVEQAMSRPAPPLEQIDGLVDAFVDFASANEHYAVMAFRELADSHLEIESLLKESVHPILDEVVGWVRAGQQAGLFKDFDPVYFLMSCVGMVLFWFHAAPGLLGSYLGDDPVGPERIAIVKAETKRIIRDAVLAAPAGSS